MRKLFSLLLVGSVVVGYAASARADDDNEKAVYPTAIITFEERGSNVKEMGLQVSDLLFAELAANEALFLVDRAEFAKTLAEQSLNVTGAVKADQAIQVGQLTGAQLLVTGSVLQADKKLYLVAKIIGTETSRVLGASVNGKASDELGPLVAELAKKISTLIEDDAEKLVARKVEKRDRIDFIREQLGEKELPSLWIEVSERHVGVPTSDPAVQTELESICKALDFDVIDTETKTQGAADIVITGEGFSELAGRLEGLVSVKARVELKIVDRQTGKVLASDRQTTVVVDSSEQIAGKAALQEAAAKLAERMLPKIVSQSE
ncbi:MAG: CsgG/HfaB family protein [Planctomycetaceae bacterium]